jgi:electron transfer flavoprotein alpha subunit
MASKKILAINTDPEANMVTKADYAVIGDLHKVVPAITAEIHRRRG